VHPGDVIWVRGGTYVGNFQSSLSGTANSPIVVHEYPGEHATLDGAKSPTSPTLEIDGQNSWFWDLEITNSNPIRVVNYSGSVGPRGDGVDNFGVGTKLINLVIHDEANGIGHWSTGLNPFNTQSPTVTGMSVNYASLTRMGVDPGNFSFAVTNSEAMNTSAAPTVTFPSNASSSSFQSPKTTATLREWMAGEDHLWTFLRVRGTKPTNIPRSRGTA
jgi:hypothetical protein